MPVSGSAGDALVSDGIPNGTSAECRRPWPTAAEDPRAGVYVLERRLAPAVPMGDDAPMLFDGSTVTTYRQEVGLRDLRYVQCRYSLASEVADHLRAPAPYRYHAHVTDDGWLLQLLPCGGWTATGRFVDHRIKGSSVVFRRLPLTELRERLARGDAYIEGLTDCRDTYESRGGRPPLPARVP